MFSTLLDSPASVWIALLAVSVTVIGAYFFFGQASKTALNPSAWIKLQLITKIQLTHNTYRFRFALSSRTMRLGLPIGQHVSMRGWDAKGKDFTRPYTPTTLDSDEGIMDLVVKIYPKGAMSQYLAQRNVGDYVQFLGPKGRFKYEVNMARFIAMIAGGTGITPMYQVARAVLENPEDKTNIHLIFANVSVTDILLKPEVDRLLKKYPQRFTVTYIVDSASPEWTGEVGYVTAELLKKTLPAPADDVMILRCGPPGMNKAVAGQLENLGYSKERLFQF